jgi:hypothetical protein
MEKDASNSTKKVYFTIENNLTYKDIIKYIFLRKSILNIEADINTEYHITNMKLTLEEFYTWNILYTYIKNKWSRFKNRNNKNDTCSLMEAPIKDLPERRFSDDVDAKAQKDKQENYTSFDNRILTISQAVEERIILPINIRAGDFEYKYAFLKTFYSVKEINSAINNLMLNANNGVHYIFEVTVDAPVYQEIAQQFYFIRISPQRPLSATPLIPCWHIRPNVYVELYTNLNLQKNDTTTTNNTQIQ